MRQPGAASAGALNEASDLRHAWHPVGVPAEFRVCDAAEPPASNLIAAVLAEYDELVGSPLRGGPSATAEDFSPPSGAYIVGSVDGRVACGGGVKTLRDGIGELKRMYVVAAFRGRGLAGALLSALEDAARGLGHRAVRLDSQAPTWPMYQARGYREIEDYNGNPHADCWGEKRL
jgi:GNAT superfamily N-acetyltransferase